MPYSAPVEDMLFVLQELCDLESLATLPGLEDCSAEAVRAILTEAAKFSEDVLAPLNRFGDQTGLVFSSGDVTTPPGWKHAYQSLKDMGWNSPTASLEHGGLGLPHALNACIQEMFQGANMAFQLCPMLTQGAVEAIENYAAQNLKSKYLPKLVSGEWAGTMNLTEPQAGSDLAAIRSRAVPHGDHFLIRGQKIFITYGEHDLAENIIHLVLARLPDAPAGVKGISLFLVPKFLAEDDGTLAVRNDLRCISIEHKLGIHASPTCTLSFGDKGGAVGYLVGEANCGLEYMFTMMNSARLHVGIQAIGVAEHATQYATSYAFERRQGRTADASMSGRIVGHPDIRRLLATMRARTEAARGLACRAAEALDRGSRSWDGTTRAYYQRRLDLLIPVVKGCSTEGAIETASAGVQIHGGMGYIEETGAAQFMRDVRITTIYEGTTGIQALDLVGRKILRDEGQAAHELIATMKASGGKGNGPAAQTLNKAAMLLEEIIGWLLAEEPELALAAATNVLEVFGLCCGLWVMADSETAAQHKLTSGDTSDFLERKIAMASVYTAQIYPRAVAYRDLIMAGTRSYRDLPPALLAVS